MAAQKNWKIFQLDVKSAFLNEELREEVYVEQPREFETKELENKEYKLEALYGLKQAPRAWYSTTDKYFFDNGFPSSESEPTLYVKAKKNGEMLVVCFCVDDMIYKGNSLKFVKEFQENMMSKFEMTDLQAYNTIFWGWKFFKILSREVCLWFA